MPSGNAPVNGMRRGRRFTENNNKIALTLSNRLLKTVEDQSQELDPALIKAITSYLLDVGAVGSKRLSSESETSGAQFKAVVKPRNVKTVPPENPLGFTQ